MSDTCPDCRSTDVADLVGGGRLCLDCDRVWGAGRSGKHPAEPLDLTELNTIADMAEFLNEPIVMSPAQLRTVLIELRATRESEALMTDTAVQLGDLLKTARTELVRITGEFGDYDALLQSREICDDRIAKLGNVRKMHAEFTSERYAWDHLHNAAFGAVVTTLGNVLDGATFEPDLDRMLTLATTCMHETWVFKYPASHPDGAVQVCGSCGIERDEVSDAEDNQSDAITRKTYLRKMGLVK